MITITSCSLTMEKIKNTIKKSMERQGCVLPTLFIFNEKRPLPISNNFSNSLIHEINHQVSSCGLDTYISTVSFIMDKLEDEKEIHKIVHHIIGQYRPAVMAFVTQCMFKDVKIGKKVKAGEVIGDPTSLRGIQIVLYSQYNKVGFSTMMPFIDEINKDTVLGNSNPYRISFIDYPWYPATGDHKVKLPNPYFE